MLGAIAVLAASGISTSPGRGSAPAAVEAAAVTSSMFVPLGPFRLADSRRSECGCRHLDATTLSIDVTAHAQVPDDTVAVAVTVTATPTAQPGHLTIYPHGRRRPTASILNTVPDRVVANSAIVPLGDDGRLDVFHLRPGDVIVDITGAFVPASSSRSGRYLPLANRRLVDTRRAPAPDGPLPRGGSLRVPLPPGVSTDAMALVVNVTSVLEPAPGHLSVRPAGAKPRTSSILNVDGSGAAVAASVIVPVSADGFVIDSFQGGHVVVDALGWFTGPSAPDDGDGLFVPHDPERILDTRLEGERLHAGGTIEVLTPFGAASALATNVTVTRADRAGHVTAHAARAGVPGTSTVNSTHWNHTVANLAITSVSLHGLAYRSFAGTDLVVDVTGWFTGTPTPATTAKAPNTPSRSRVLLVGDSTLAAVDLYSESKRALVGFDSIVDAKSCRRLQRPSCLSAVTGVIPNTAVEAILTTAGRVDIVVVKTGYNDWFSDFPAEFDAVVSAARQKGAHTVVWLTYNEEARPASRTKARQAYAENNVDLRRLASDHRYRDVIVVDWLGYSWPHRYEWFWDGTHMTSEGTWAQTDYVARWIAAIEHRPCPRPRSPGAPVADPCQPPDSTGAYATPSVLYR